MSLKGIYNFITISDSMATSDQLTEAQLKDIAEAGYHVVVNLALKTYDNAFPDEAKSVQALGIQYHNIPVIFDAPKKSDLSNSLNQWIRSKAKKFLCIVQQIFERRCLRLFALKNAGAGGVLNQTHTFTACGNGMRTGLR
jgi:protein tyrosine phosphatase (PTP) superfamily phosphohydrolase (DUF442 family)